MSCQFPDAPPSPAEPSESRWQFSLRAVLIVQAVCALFLGLLMIWGVFAVLAAFVASGFFAMLPFDGRQSAMQWRVLDVLWGIVFPAACLIYDPGFLLGVGQSAFAEGASLVYLALLWQMFVLAVWLAAGRWLHDFCGYFAGSMFLGTLAAFVLGIVLLPYSLFGMFLRGIGILGYVPFAAAYAYGCNAARARRAGADPRRTELATWSELGGAALAIAVPVLLNWAVGPAIIELIRLCEPLRYRPF